MDTEGKAKFLSPSHPLWLPQGSIRALITFGTLTLVGIVLLTDRMVPDWLVLWAGLIVKNYFDTREVANGTEK